MAIFRGTAGIDRIVGSAAADRVNGFAGRDFLSGFLGNDIIEGGADDDVIDGGKDFDTLSGGGNNDTILGGEGGDVLNGGEGDDVVDGGEGDDKLNGGEGDDLILATLGSDSASGGGGDDVYALHGVQRTQVVVFDTSGIDTFDFSAASTFARIDLSAGGVSTVDGRTVEITGGGVFVQPLDLVLLQDLSGSFGDDVAVVSGLVPQITSAILSFQPDSQFGVSSFVDKAIGPFGGGSDYVYQTDLALTNDTVALQNAIDGLTVLGGGDLPESQIEALMQLALRTDEVGFRADSFKIVVLTTDAEFHVAGDGAGLGLVPNDGDDVIEGGPGGTEEDYPTVGQVRSALLATGIIPIFAVTSNVVASYEQLVADLGFGAVATLSSDSSDLVDALLDGITSITEGVIENAIGTAFSDTIEGNNDANLLVGGGGNDSIRGLAARDTLEGGNGEDTLQGDAGRDVVAGGGGDDTLNGGTGRDLADFGGGGAVAVDLLAGSATGQGSDDLAGIEDVVGSNGNDTIEGSNFINDLLGSRGNDELAGRGGNDTLAGGLGADELAGNTGADRFRFLAVTDSTADDPDKIVDFRHVQGDRIDLVAIDADVTMDGNQRFSFLGVGGGGGAGAGSLAFTDPGQLRATVVTGGLRVEGSVDGDADAEFVVLLTGISSLVAGDFIL